MMHVASHVASNKDGSDGTNVPDVAVAPAAPVPPDNTPPGDTKRSPIPRYWSVTDPNAAPELGEWTPRLGELECRRTKCSPTPTGWGSGGRSHVTGVREWANNPHERRRQKPKPVGDNGGWRKRKIDGDQTKMVSNVRKGFRHWLKTANW